MAKRKKGKGQAKGSAFERDICHKLSLWWTHNQRDDIFWRASQSGGRATERAKHGKSTANSNGDVAYLDVIGKPFLDKVCIEIKRGYSQSDTTSLIDKSYSNALLYKFIEQASRSKRNAGARFWMLIQKRDMRTTLIHVATSMIIAMSASFQETWTATLLRFECSQLTIIPLENEESLGIVSIPMDNFLEVVSPEIFMGL